MKLSEIKSILASLSDVAFRFENGIEIAAHFHVTEIGIITKRYIDCGGKIRNEEIINFQLWHANDFEHRLRPQKLLQIIDVAECQLGIKDTEVEVEYQGETIGRYNLYFDGKYFVLQHKTTACLATDQCGIPEEKSKINLSSLNNKQSSCTPGGGCC